MQFFQDSLPGEFISASRCFSNNHLRGEAQWFAAAASVQTCSLWKTSSVLKNLLGRQGGSRFKFSYDVDRSALADGINDSRNNNSGSPKKQNDIRGREAGRGMNGPFRISSFRNILPNLIGNVWGPIKLTEDKARHTFCNFSLLPCNLSNHSKKLFSFITHSMWWWRHSSALDSNVHILYGKTNQHFQHSDQCACGVKTQVAGLNFPFHCLYV